MPGERRSFLGPWRLDRDERCWMRPFWSYEPVTFSNVTSSISIGGNPYISTVAKMKLLKYQRVWL